MSGITKLIGWCAKHSSDLMVAGGIVAGIGSVIFTAIGTTKAGAILDAHKEEMDEIDEAAALDVEEYTEKDIRKDRIKVFTKTGLGLAKVYAPAALCGVGSVVLTLAGYGKVRKACGAATAALTATQSLFSAYRGRVINEEGTEKDQHYLFGSRIEKIEEKVVDNKTGKEKTVKRDVEYIDIDIDTDTGAIQVFGEYRSNGEKNPEWDENIDWTISQLRARENYFNNMLRAKKIIFLNEVLEDIGLAPTKAGQILGWTWKEGRTVSFGIGDWSDPQVRRVVNGHTNYLVLHFNVDGEYEANNIDNGEDLITAKSILDSLEA
ncbi:MAG: hypothetical protein J6Y02_23915 [Pseudobutyrivibrio sp.]|nr:hypothetical protein [Pseudobutyrivibrio sp.]